MSEFVQTGSGKATDRPDISKRLSYELAGPLAHRHIEGWADHGWTVRDEVYVPSGSGGAKT